MTKLTFDDINENNGLLYKYVRGSHLYGLNNANSDVDTGGVYYAPFTSILGLGLDYCDEISDPKHDNVIYELQKYFKLLGTSNPTMLESLFVDDSHVIYEHPIFKEIREYKDMFLTKKLYMPFVGYAQSQIKKAVGLHKLCVNPVKERKDPLDFCFTTYKQGSSSMKEWLAARGLDQKFCGLVSLNNMPNCYGVYYDFGGHNKYKYKTAEDFSNDLKYIMFVNRDTFLLNCSDDIIDWFNRTQTPLKYRGIVKDSSIKIPIDEVKNHKEIVVDNDGDYYIYDKDGKFLTVAEIIEEDGVKYIVSNISNSDVVRCSSIPKDEKPICIMTYNKDGYTQHCNKYAEYQKWLKERNQARYEENAEKTYDGKNMMHCLRLLSMAKEIFKGQGVQLNRKIAGDSEFLLGVRAHKFKYEEINEFLEAKLQEVDKAYNETVLPEEIDVDHVNDLFINIRKKLYKL